MVPRFPGGAEKRFISLKDHLKLIDIISTKGVTARRDVANEVVTTASIVPFRTKYFLIIKSS